MLQLPLLSASALVLHSVAVQCHTSILFAASVNKSPWLNIIVNAGAEGMPDMGGAGGMPDMSGSESAGGAGPKIEEVD